MAKKREVDRLVRKWRDRLWLGKWKVTIQFVDPMEKGPDDTEHWVGVASVETMLRYKSATVSVVKDTWDTCTVGQKNRHACHEMMHVVVDPLNKLLIRAMNELPTQKAHVYEQWRSETLEGVTEDLTTAFLDAYKELKGSA